MGEGFNIIFLSLLPALVYMFVIYITVPYKTINLKTALLYLVIGFMSVGFLKNFWIVFPDWKHIAEWFTGVPPLLKPLKYYHYYFFVQVGFIEEFSKLIIFLLIEKFRRNNFTVNDHPLGTMFYMGMVALGFAVIENIQYGMLSMDPTSTLYWRSFTSVIGHMVFGFFMGYWISYGRLGKKEGARSILGLFLNKFTKFKKVFYVIIGIFCASVLHGMYNLELTLQGAGGSVVIYMLLIGSLMGCFWCFKHLIKEHQLKLNK